MFTSIRPFFFAPTGEDTTAAFRLPPPLLSLLLMIYMGNSPGRWWCFFVCWAERKRLILIISETSRRWSWINLRFFYAAAHLFTARTPVSAWARCWFLRGRRCTAWSRSVLNIHPTVNIRRHPRLLSFLLRHGLFAGNENTYNTREGAAAVYYSSSTSLRLTATRKPIHNTYNAHRIRMFSSAVSHPSLFSSCTTFFSIALTSFCAFTHEARWCTTIKRDG